MNRDFCDSFSERHIGPRREEKQSMLSSLGLESEDELINQVVPKGLKRVSALNLPAEASEHQALGILEEIANTNELNSDFIGTGYYGSLTPPVIRRNILENPGWYTQYTPYQAEIAQGRLEALLNFQTAVCSLTGMDIANGSLLDEATAAAEAITLAYGIQKKDKKNTVFVSSDCHPQNIEVMKTRCAASGLTLELISDFESADLSEAFALVVQYPNTKGVVTDFCDLFKKAKSLSCLSITIADPLSLALLKTPGELGADIAVGSTQRLGVPLGFGGPHAGYFATREEFKRKVPGRIVGISKDRSGKPALRLALQTREQHIRRDKATSNICTSQVLLAIMSSMYCVYHGPKNIKKIADSIHLRATQLASALKAKGHEIFSDQYFDTVVLKKDSKTQTQIKSRAQNAGVNLRYYDDGCVGISISESTSSLDLKKLCVALDVDLAESIEGTKSTLRPAFLRKSGFLEEAIFNKHHTEPQLTRYIKKLEKKDLSLTHSMIPLGSCTMKLNAAAELYPVSWPKFAALHPFAPAIQSKGYEKVINDLCDWLGEITGFDAVSLQPNSGAQGEYAGLLAIKGYLEANSESSRNICLIPTSAHGTNPASAVMAGMSVVPVLCDKEGNIDLEDLHKKIEKHKDKLACLMITYPSTHGVYEESIVEVCDAIHGAGGLVYMDGANMNAQVGLVRPGDFGADVCHLNLHKTFCIPHGGGGPGVGPIAAVKKLAPYMPGHAQAESLAGNKGGPVSAAPYGSAGILVISWMYIRMMGSEGLKSATKTAILNANYIAKRLNSHYPVLFTGKNGYVAHECIIDLRELKKSAGIEVEDVAKRLIDYGFHAPTMAWPVPGTLMIEPTESESKDELDRFCDAMIAIRTEIKDIESGAVKRDHNILKNAPHTSQEITGDWPYQYSRQQAVFPLEWVIDNKFWPSVGRVDNAFGDRNLVCSCGDVSEYSEI